MVVDKNQAIIDFLQNCPQIAQNRLFFNFINGKSNDKQLVTVANDVSIQQPYIDGSIMKRYTFTIIDFRSVTYQAVVMQPNHPNENVEELLDVQGIINWVTEQADNRNYPDFGQQCIIDSMKTTTDTPNLNSVDRNVTPALAKYSISIQIDYIDITKKIM